MKRIAGCLIVAAFAVASPSQIDLNRATSEEIATLPVTEEQAKAIHDRITFQGPLQSVYDLVDVPGIDMQTFLAIKPLVRISPEWEREGTSRVADLYDRLDRWSATEGASEGQVEVWLDRLAEPLDVNRASYDDLAALQNVSPVDAAAVARRLRRFPIRNARDLRGVTGLSYWGYRNMIDFVTTDTTAAPAPSRSWVHFIYKNVPSTVSFDEEAASPATIRRYPPGMLHKWSWTAGARFKLAAAYHRQPGEMEPQREFETYSVPDLKVSATWSNLRLGPVTMKRMVLGNFSASFGQGVVFESTDFFGPRRTGYGWTKRAEGIFHDISQTKEFSLRGAAGEVAWGPVTADAFISKHPRDAILNPSDGSVSYLLVLAPRRESVVANGLRVPLAETVEEVTWSGRLRLAFAPGTSLGITSYESLYDRELRPDVRESVLADDSRDKYLTQIGNTADPEISAAYASAGSSPIWGRARAVRRVQGLDVSAVVRNIALQGEVGVLDRDGDVARIASDPKAWVASAYLQFSSLNLLFLYRDTDLEFDNPYQRSFSNYQRFKGTIFEDPFYLATPVYGYLHSAAPQPQAERGLYISGRYQFHRQWVWTQQWDAWRRAADGARYERMVASVEYRPVFNWRIRLRQKWQTRGRLLDPAPNGFDSRETRLGATLRLSGFDEMELLYASSRVAFSPRRRLSVDLPTLGGSISPIGTAELPGDGIGFSVTHNFSDRLKATGSALLYRGFIWNFEDTDFRVFDSPTDALRSWISLYSRVSERMALRFKVTWDHRAPVTNYAYAENRDTGRVLWGNLASFDDAIDFRVQVDYVQ